MPVDVTMPKLSDTMEEGKILKWVKAVGDHVQPGDVLAEVETDKADMDLEAFDEGVLSEVRVAEGQSAPVGTVIAVLSADGEKAEASKDRPSPAKADAKKEQGEPAKAEHGASSKKDEPEAQPEAEAPEGETAKPAPGARKATQPTPMSERGVAPVEREAARPIPLRRAEAPAEGGRVRVSPLARRVARDHGVDPAQLRGSGPGGRVVERDVQEATASGGAPKQPAEPASQRADVAAPAGKSVELPRMRRTVARRMFEAKRDVPHFYVSSDILMDEAVRVKAELTALDESWKGLTVTHLIIKAVGMALRRVPEMNASPDGDRVILHDAVNVGIATAVDGGLVVPVVRGCDKAPLAEIARNARALVERARAVKFAADDLTGATFTVSNLGMLPVSEFAAIINQPQAGILAVGAVRAVPVVREGQVVPGQVMTVTLSADHRIVDGMLAGRFLAEVKGLLERPVALLV
jgi:pyruvate dehydrogenase E2 component (dihydrolipoamide acetyltransferase)